MSKNRSQKKSTSLVTPIVFIFLALAGAAIYLLSSQEAPAGPIQWEGEWDISYYYDNNEDYIYTGTLFLTERDSLQGVLEVYLPTGHKPITVALRNLQKENNGTSLRGRLVFDLKIRGGYLQESVLLDGIAPDKFQGKGKCVSNCAEYTEESTIYWSGSRRIPMNE